ncbi:ovomucoid-like [Haliotis rubra]|uniref:ovomucoid-like n=1 Tax=Haliotis rubra TaxID=36100 RepID=UPI001EE59878|nr:ovomucoid-like [Haliotis rubra]XP_046559790.1 ovomucoid-like [Haliotis rubra]
MLRVAVVLGLLSVSSAQLFPDGWFGSQFTCRLYQQRDCSRYTKHEECGTDGVTYDNRCYFTQARCKDSVIDVAYYGACDKRTITGGPVLSGEEAVLDFFCQELSHEDCPADKDEVCATDRVTYDNFCEYEKEKCTHRDLHIITFGQCPT